MDPNAALERIRAILNRYKAAPEEMTNEDAWGLFDDVEALDGWLSRGGFLPKAWEAGR